MTNRPLVTDTTLVVGIVTRLAETPVTQDLPVRHSIIHRIHREATTSPVLNSPQGHLISTIAPCMFFFLPLVFFSESD